jgi:hypothetical protein
MLILDVERPMSGTAIGLFELTAQQGVAFQPPKGSAR